ncbi:MAG: TonB-dependent receptor [bacterium]|nr:TonB-dependent receptor [bacterium]
MKKLTFLVCMLMLAFTNNVFGQATGKITGKVMTTDAGPAMGASVLVVELKNVGASTDLEGNYTILNIPPGTYTLRFSYIGYSDVVVKGVVVTSGLTFRQNATLKPEGIQREEIIVTAERPKIQLDDASGGATIRQEDITRSVSKDVVGMISKQAGVKIGKEGELHVRGGRKGEVAFLIDGVDVRDPILATNTNINLDAVAVSEVSLLTDGFSPEYGQALSGIINVSFREGDADKYSAKVEYLTDQPFGKASFDTDKMLMFLSGPVPGTKSLMVNPLTFLLQVNSMWTNTYLPYNVKRSSNDYLGIGLNLPERQQNTYDITAKFAYQLPSKEGTKGGAKKVSLTYTGFYQKWDLYPYGEANVSGNYGYRYKYNVENRPWAWSKRNSATIQFVNNLSSKTNYNLSFTYQNSHTEVQPRNKNPGQFTLRTKVEDLPFAGGLDLDGNGFPDGFVDANNNNIYDGGGEGYTDLNENGRWDRGEDWIDLNQNGAYDAAEPWIDRPDPVTGQNNLGVYDPWDPYTDLNRNGRWDGAEPQLPSQDWNRNGRWDGERYQDANGNGRFDPWEPYEDTNGNGIYDLGEPFTDLNGNGVHDDGEGYDDINFDGRMNRRELVSANQDTQEPFLDGDFFYDTGEPFIDQPDPVTGAYNGRWDIGEPFLDLPSSNFGFGMFEGGIPTPNGIYDGPGNGADEYELFCRPATPAELRANPALPVIYSYNWNAAGSDWPRDGRGRLDPLQYVNGRSTWVNQTIHDRNNPRFDPPNFSWDPEEEAFIDYNQNGVQNGRDLFLNPGLWDEQAVWQDRRSIEYSMKFGWQSQINKFHELKAGVELKYRDLKMQSIIGPDLPYTGEVPLPPGSPWPDRGDIRDFYNYKPIEGAFYFNDKMEFEGLIVNAGIRSDFMITDRNLVRESKRQVSSGIPGAIEANPGKIIFSPRLGISHPITKTAKLFFNYGHFYQRPDFSTFFRSTTANVAAGSVIGNPNLKYTKTVQYALGVHTELPDGTTFMIQGYYKDYFDLIGTQTEQYGPLTIDRYANKAYGRSRGFELDVDRTFSEVARDGEFRANFTYDFSFTAGKSSSDDADARNRLLGVPANTEEYPLDWDERHHINASIGLQFREGKYPHFGDFKLPLDDWLLTMETQYGSGVPYTPSQYTTGMLPSLIPTNSARYPWTENTNLKFEKYFRFGKDKPAGTFKRTIVTVGVDVNNIWNKRNVNNLYSETGNPYQAIHPENPAFNPFDNRTEYDRNPRNFSPPRQILFRIGLAWE